MLRFALIVAALIVSGSAHAYPATATGGQWRCVSCFTGSPGGASTTTGFTYSTAAAACQAANPSSVWYGYWGGGSGTSTYVSHSGVSNDPCLWNTSGNTHASGSASQDPSSTYTCPGGGTLSGTTCTCASGDTDTGTACVSPVCPAVGASLGDHNLSIAWALSPTVGANDMVSGSMVLPGATAQCVPNGSDMCGGVVDYSSPTSTSGRCYRSQTPNAEGLYRISCDYAIKSTGTAACTPDDEGASSPVQTPAECPTGNVGSVNGKPVCLGTIPTSGVNFGKPSAPGNPRAGSKPSDSNSAREPDSASGGGADARGGPGVTTGFGGGTGTGAGSNPDTGSQLPKIEIELETCGLPGKPKCQIDETGTPSGTGADTTAKAALDTEAQKSTDKLAQVVAGDGAPDSSWGFSISFPTTCTPFTVGTDRWGFFEVDFCEFQDEAHGIMSLVWVATAVFGCIGMVFRAINAG